MLPVPDRTTLSRRGRALAGRQPRLLFSTGPIDLVLDGAGLELFGRGGWDAERHGRVALPQGECYRAEVIASSRMLLGSRPSMKFRSVAAGGPELASYDGFGSLGWWAACDGAPDCALVRAADVKPRACGALRRGFKA